ncbi:MAG: hypothetical protein LBF84_03430 [Holosporales bacterium]|jgi:hypothetical protein|nr:hypothetical protein [Holosporales bacterium]
MRLKALFLSSVFQILAISRATSHMDTDDVFGTVCNVCKGAEMQLCEAADGECSLQDSDLLAKPGCFSLAPLGVQLAEMRAAVRELQRVCGVFQKDISYCKKQGKLLSGIEPKISANKKSLVEVSIGLGSLEEQIAILRDQTNHETSDIFDQLESITTDISQKMTTNKQEILSNVEQSIQTSLQSQSSSIAAQLGNFANAFTNLQCILGANDNFLPLDDNYINQILEEIAFLKDRLSTDEKNMGDVNNLAFKSALRTLDPALPATSSCIMDFLKSIVSELLALKTNFDNRTQAVMTSTISGLNEDVAEILERLEIIGGDLQGLVDVLASVSSDDVTNLKNIHAIVGQNVNTYVNGEAFSQSLISLCSVIIQVLVEKMVPELIQGTKNELLSEMAELPTASDIEELRTTIQEAVAAGLEDLRGEMALFPDFEELVHTVNENREAIRNFMCGGEEGNEGGGEEVDMPNLQKLVKDCTQHTADIAELQDKVSEILDAESPNSLPGLVQLVETLSGTDIDKLQDDIAQVSATLEALPNIGQLVEVYDSAITTLQSDVSGIETTLVDFAQLVTTQGEHGTALNGLQGDVSGILAAFGAPGVAQFVETQGAHALALTDLRTDLDELSTNITNISEQIDDMLDLTLLEAAIAKQNDLIEEQEQTIDDLNTDVVQMEATLNGKINALDVRIQTLETSLAALIVNLSQLLEVSEPTLKSTSTRG